MGLEAIRDSSRISEPLLPLELLKHPGYFNERNELWDERDLNPRHPDLQSGALPV